MTEAAKQARREYYREYRKKHPEKYRQQQLRYWEKKAREQAAELEKAAGGAPAWLDDPALIADPGEVGEQ